MEKETNLFGIKADDMWKVFVVNERWKNFKTKLRNKDDSSIHAEFVLGKSELVAAVYCNKPKSWIQSVVKWAILFLRFFTQNKSEKK